MQREGWEDPHGILTEEFREAFGDADSVREALREAERQSSSTDRADMERCSECLATRLRPRRPADPTTPDDLAQYKCQTCGSDVDEPLPSERAVENGETTGRQRRRVREAKAAFEWLDEGALVDADERSGLTPPLGGLDRETAVGVAIYLRAPWRDGDRPSYTEIARWLSYADSWVGHRVREWRDGEHRDLVPDPTDEEGGPTTTDDPPIDPSVAVARIGGDYDELVAGRTSTDASSDADAVATDGGARTRRWAAYGSD